MKIEGVPFGATNWSTVPETTHLGSTLPRVFPIDVTACRRCGGKLRVVAAITDADEIAQPARGRRSPTSSDSSRAAIRLAKLNAGFPESATKCGS